MCSRQRDRSTEVSGTDGCRGHSDWCVPYHTVHGHSRVCNTILSMSLNIWVRRRRELEIRLPSSFLPLNRRYGEQVCCVFSKHKSLALSEQEKSEKSLCSLLSTSICTAFHVVLTSALFEFCSLEFQPAKQGLVRNTTGSDCDVARSADPTGPRQERPPDPTGQIGRASCRERV